MSEIVPTGPQGHGAQPPAVGAATSVDRVVTPFPLQPFTADAKADLTPALRRRLSQPLYAGVGLIVVFLVGAGVWSMVTPVAGGVTAPGVVKPENNRKTLKHPDGGVVQTLSVHEGDLVKKGQVLLTLDDAQSRAQVDILQNQYDNFLAQRARYEADLQHRAAIAFPEELTSRRSDPRIALLMQNQENLFVSNRSLIQAQSDVLRQRVEELGSRIGGLKSQIEAIDSQSRLVKEESDGLKGLYAQGYAPKTRVLAMDRSMAQLAGDRGAQIAQVAQTEQTIGETRIQLAQLAQQATTVAADGLRDTQTKLSDVIPRLRAAQVQLDATKVRSPVDGYVLNLTQFTLGGVIRPGEDMMDIVPIDAPLIIEAKLRPDMIDEVRPGTKALVTFSGYHARRMSKLDADVITVSADQKSDPRGQAFFDAQVRIKPEELKRLPPGVRLTPGLPASAIFTTGDRTVFEYLIGPLRDTITNSMHEQ